MKPTSAHSLVMIDLSGPRLSADERALLRSYQVGGICLFRRNFLDRYQMAEFAAELRELCGEHLLLGVDQEGGTVVRALDVPYSIGNMALGSVNDPDITRQLAAASARGLKAMGINLNFAPVADVNNNPANPVIGDRSFGARADEVARHVVAFVQGLQAEGVAATLKHFPGHGDTATDSHHDLPQLDASLERLHALELVPFKAGIAAGAACVMSYHGKIMALDPDKPGTLSPKVMSHLLRDSLGFDGLCFTDALEMQAIGKTYGAEESVIRALEAGIDMPLYDVHQGSVKQHEAIFKAVDKAYETGRLNAGQIKRSLEALWRLAKRYPARPQAEAAWQEGDQERLATAAARAVSKIGNLPVLEPGTRLTLVAADTKVGGSASDMTLTPAYALASTLEQAGFVVDKQFYQPELADRFVETLNIEAPILFVSASRTRLTPAEIQLAKMLAAKALVFVHVALWNPYISLDIGQASIISFGFSQASLMQVAEVLKAKPAMGQIPF